MLTYVISSPGRSGSQYLQSLLSLLGNPVISTHNPWYECKFDQSCLLLLQRRDIVSSILSSLVVDHTGEWNVYSNKPVHAIKIDCDGPNSVLYLRYMFHKWYWQSHDLSRPWAKVEKLYFDDFIDNHQHVFQKLGVPNPNKNPKLPIIAPYRAQDIIANYQECVSAIRQWEQHPGEFQPVIPTQYRVPGRFILQPGKSIHDLSH